MKHFRSTKVIFSWIQLLYNVILYITIPRATCVDLVETYMILDEHMINLIKNIMGTNNPDNYRMFSKGESIYTEEEINIKYDIVYTILKVPQIYFKCSSVHECENMVKHSFNSKKTSKISSWFSVNIFMISDLTMYYCITIISKDRSLSI